MIVQLSLRGAVILGVGFALGYAKAVHDSDEIRDLLQDLVEELKEFPKDATPAQDGSAEEVVEAIEVTAEPEPATPQGETS